MVDLLSGTFLVLGSLLAVIAGVGLHRFDDVFARMHAATKPATLGLALVLVGAAMHLPDVGSVTKLVLVIALQFATAPVGAHLVGRAAYRAGNELSTAIRVDELAAAEQQPAGPTGGHDQPGATD